MRRIALVSSASLLALQAACNLPKKGKSDASEGPTQDPGQVNVETDPEEEKVDESQNVTDGVLDPNAEKVQMTGSLAIAGTGLAAGSKPDKVLAFPIRGGQLKSVQEVLKADVDADGKFSIALPRIEQSIVSLQAAIKDDKLDREKLKEYLKSVGDEGGDILTMPDAEVIEQVKAEIDKSKNTATTYVVVSMVSSPKADGLEKRTEEASSFAFIGLSAGGKNLFNIPVAASKRNLDLGKITISGDDAKSDVKATEDGRFDLSADTLTQLAATGATLKAIKNDYANTNPTTGETFHSSPFFAFQGDLEEVGLDSYTKLDVGYDRDSAANPQVGYHGYGLYMSGTHKDPSNPAVDLMTKNLCADDRRKFEFFPPLGANIKIENSAGIFDGNTPMKMENASALTPFNDNTRFQCGSTVNDELYYAAGNSPTDKGLNWNWGSGGSLLGNVPAGLWKLEVEGQHLASFDLAAAQPLTSLSATEAVANVFVPQIKVTKDNAGLITMVDVKFSYYDSEAKVFKVVTNLEALKRGVEELSIDFDDYTGTREGNRIKLEGVTATDGVFSGDPTKGENPEPMLFPVAGADAQDRVADSISVSYRMYGISYRFDFRLR